MDEIKHNKQLTALFDQLVEFTESLERGAAQCVVVIAVTRDGQGCRVVRLMPGTTLVDASKMLVELEIQAHAIKTQLLMRQEKAWAKEQNTDTVVMIPVEEGKPN